MDKYRVAPMPLVRAPKGRGSTSIHFDLYFDAASNNAIAFSPRKLDLMLRRAIKYSGMKRRCGLLDVWKSKESGPCTSFHSLQESHVRVETWPEDRHINAEAQLCNYSRNNAGKAWQLFRLIEDALNPARTQVIVVVRGPGVNLSTSDTFTWDRTTPTSIKGQLCPLV